MFKLFGIRWFLNNCTMHLDSLFGGGSDAQAPNYDAMAAASTHAADVGKQLGDAQLAENKRQYDLNQAANAPIVAKQAALMDQQQAQGNDYFNYMKQNSRPLEQGMLYQSLGLNQDEIAQIEAARAQEATGSPDAGGAVNSSASNALINKLGVTANLRAQQEGADTAIADSRKGFTDANNMAIRQGLRYGMSPEKIAAAQEAVAAQQAETQAGAAAGARDKVKNTLYAKQLDQAGLYRGLTGASQAAYGLTLNSGNSAVNNQNATSAQYLKGMDAGTGTIMQGQGLNIQGQSAILNNQTSAYNSANSSSGSDGLFGALGQIGGAVASKMITSDKKVKKDIKPTSDNAALDAIKKTPVSSWQYDQSKIDNGDTATHTGPMAQDVQKNMGDKAGPGGKVIDLISMNGINMSAIKALSKKVDKLEKHAKGGK